MKNSIVLCTRTYDKKILKRITLPSNFETKPAKNVHDLEQYFQCHV